MATRYKKKDISHLLPVLSSYGHSYKKKVSGRNNRCKRAQIRVTEMTCAKSEPFHATGMQADIPRVLQSSALKIT